VSVLHHPYNWFQSGSARELRRVIEASSDLVLTGHEHDCDSYRVARDDSKGAGYVEGGVFGASGEDGPSFNVVQIDPHQGRYCVISFRWNGDAFTSDGREPPWHPFVFTASRFAREQLLSDDMLALLNDPGLPLTHRAKPLGLEDIFVAPELRTYEHTDPSKPAVSAAVPSDMCISQLFGDRHAYLLGEGQCGKTALGKMLFLHSIRREQMPVFVDGGRIRTPNARDLTKLIDGFVQQQYRDVSPETFWQLPKDTRAVIVDDLGEAKPNASGKAQVAAWLHNHFGTVFLLGGDRTQIEDVIAGQAEQASLVGFKRYEIKPFGYLLREILIEKWITLGKEHELERDDLDHELRTTVSTLNRLLSDNLLPANPVYILLLLQQLEAEVPLDTSPGSYGAFYEAIVTLALHGTSRSPEGVGMKYTYLSELAWRMFRDGQTEIEDEDFNAFTREHVERFRLTEDADVLKQEIQDSRLLQSHYGRYRFAYRYALYYFVARYMRDNGEDEDVQSCIANAIEEIHREDLATILIFYVYLTKSMNVVTRVVGQARLLLKGTQPCDLATHVAFITRLQAKVPSLVLPDADPKEQRRALLRDMDGAASQRPLPDEGGAVEPPVTATEHELDLFLSMNRANKIVEFLGQVLRDFSGSLRGEPKREIAQECFELGLRAVNSFYATLERHLDRLLPELAALFGKNFSGLPARKRVEAANQFVFLVTEIMCFVALRRISYAVGSEVLMRTYDDVERSYDNRATRFVQLCIRLDHCRSFPKKRVLDLQSEVKDDAFGGFLLQVLVVEHFSQFRRPYKTRQSICAQLGIALPAPPGEKPRGYLPSGRGG